MTLGEGGVGNTGRREVSSLAVTGDEEGKVTKRKK
jgi:hypothetical protein